MNPYLANFEANKGNAKFPSVAFFLATAAIIAVILSYFVLLAKLKPENESSEFSKSLQEIYEDLSIQ